MTLGRLGRDVGLQTWLARDGDILEGTSAASRSHHRESFGAVTRAVLAKLNEGRGSLRASILIGVQIAPLPYPQARSSTPVPAAASDRGQAPFWMQWSLRASTPSSL